MIFKLQINKINIWKEINPELGWHKAGETIRNEIVGIMELLGPRYGIRVKRLVKSGEEYEGPDLPFSVPRDVEEGFTFVEIAASPDAIKRLPEFRRSVTKVAARIQNGGFKTPDAHQ